MWGRLEPGLSLRGAFSPPSRYHRRTMTRRTLLSSFAAAPLFAADPKPAREPGVRLRLALNAYSFDKPLKAGAMTLHDVVTFCAQHRVDALDATGYYFPGYPAVPSDD